MSSHAVLRFAVGLISAGLAVTGALGVLIGSMDMLGFGGCFEEACTPDARTFDKRAEATLIALGAFVLGSLVCIRLARDS
jgi:hypothetical protein